MVHDIWPTLYICSILEEIAIRKQCEVMHHFYETCSKIMDYNATITETNNNKVCDVSYLWRRLFI